MESELLTLGLPALFFLVGAAFFAGFIDSMAGGGGLISIPALLLAGVPPHLSLGTNKFMSSIGTTFSFLTYARSGMVIWRIAVVGIVFSLGGSAVGSKVAMHLSSEVLGKTLLVLLPVAALLTFMPLRRVERGESSSRLRLCMVTPLVCTAIGFYDGFFGPGTGSFMLLTLHFALRLNLVKASGTSKAFNLASNLSSLVVFLLNSKIFFLAALPMAAANIAGNLIGSRMAIKCGAGLIRKVLLFSLVLLFASLIWRYYA